MSSKIFNSIKNITIILIFVKIIGFVKQAIIANYFGASSETDIFLLVSELMENLGEVLFSSIAISFVTMYINVLTNKGKEARNRLVTDVVIYGGAIVLILSGIIFVLSKSLANFIAPGYNEFKLNIVTNYLKILAFVFIIMFLVSVLKAILDAEKIFMPAKLEGLIKSCIIILACIFCGKTFGIISLVYATVVYYFITVIYLSIVVKKNINFHFDFAFKMNDQIKLLIVYSIPLFISNGSVYLQNIVDKALGSTLGDGTISYISYSGFLVNSIHSLIIGSVCTVIFSYFSTYVAEQNFERLKEVLFTSLRGILIISIYIILMVLIESEDIIEIVYGRGAFNEHDIDATAKILSIYIVGILFIGIRDVLIRVHYAFQDTFTTMVNGLIGTGANILISIILSKNLGVYGIVIGTVSSYGIVMILSIFTVRKHVQFLKESGITKLFMQLLIINIIILSASKLFDYLFVLTPFIQIFIKCGLATVIFIVYMLLIRNKEILKIKDRIILKLVR